MITLGLIGPTSLATCRHGAVLRFYPRNPTAFPEGPSFKDTYGKNLHIFSSVCIRPSTWASSLEIRLIVLHMVKWPARGESWHSSKTSFLLSLGTNQRGIGNSARQEKQEEVVPKQTVTWPSGWWKTVEGGVVCCVDCDVGVNLTCWTAWCFSHLLFFMSYIPFPFCFCVLCIY